MRTYAYCKNRPHADLCLLQECVPCVPVPTADATLVAQQVKRVVFRKRKYMNEGSDAAVTAHRKRMSEANVDDVRAHCLECRTAH